MWKKSSIKILFFTSLIVLLIGGFNWLVDPYDIFGSPKIAGFNKNKPETDSIQRVYKAINLLKNKTNVVLFGTSRTDRGIDAINPNFKNISTYNSSINSATPFEAELYCDRAMEQGATVILYGTDFFTFYAKDLTRKDFDKNALNEIPMAKYLFSISALKASAKTIHSKGLSAYGASGTYSQTKLQEENDKEGGHKKSFQTSEKGYFSVTYSKDFSKTQTVHWQAFERILDKAHKHSAKVVLFISPSHARQWEVLDIAQGYVMFEEYKRRLVATNEKIAAQNHKPPFALWDFAGYHPLTTEDVPNDPKVHMKWYWDSSHYKKELGDIVLDRMFDGNFSGGQNYPDFGEKITSQNIEAHLAKLREERAKWRASHPVDVAEIEALKTKQSK